MTLEKKRELLLKWKESGLSLPKWWRENAEELDLPHLSTLYAWVKQLGFSTEPGAEETKEPEEEHEELVETPDEMGDSDDSPEEADTEPVDDSQGSAENEIDDEPEAEDVIAKDRIEQLEPSTVPEPAELEKPVDKPKTGIKTQTLVIIGGAVVLGIGAYLLIKKISKRKAQKEQNNSMPGGNPFAGYITIDQF